MRGRERDGAEGRDQLTKGFDGRAIIRYPRMWRTLPHEIITLVVFLHERGRTKNGWQTERDPSRKPRHSCASSRRTHTHPTHTSVVTSRLSESIQTSMGHSIGVYGSSLGVLFQDSGEQTEDGKMSGRGAPSEDGELPRPTHEIWA